MKIKLFGVPNGNVHFFRSNLFETPCIYIHGPTQWHNQEFFRGVGLCQEFFQVEVGGSTNSVEDRGQRDRGSGGGSPQSGVPLNLQMNETHILIRLLRMYIPRNWEFGSALAKPRNFVGGVEPPETTPPRYATVPSC
jgi:hypothetical protein